MFMIPLKICSWDVQRKLERNGYPSQKNSRCHLSELIKLSNMDSGQSFELKLYNRNLQYLLAFNIHNLLVFN